MSLILPKTDGVTPFFVPLAYEKGAIKGNLGEHVIRVITGERVMVPPMERKVIEIIKHDPLGKILEKILLWLDEKVEKGSSQIYSKSPQVENYLQN